MCLRRFFVTKFCKCTLTSLSLFANVHLSTTVRFKRTLRTGLKMSIKIFVVQLILSIPTIVALAIAIYMANTDLDDHSDNPVFALLVWVLRILVLAPILLVTGWKVADWMIYGLHWIVT